MIERFDPTYNISAKEQEFPNVILGRYSYAVPQVQTWGEGSMLRIGSFCSINKNAKVLLGGNHRAEWVSTYPFNVMHKPSQKIKGQPYSKGDVVIGHDVWVGNEATILSGVTVGNGAVIGAKALVSKDVPPYAVVVGNPGKVIKYRFDPPVIAALQRIAWWNWPDDRIEKAIPLLMTGDIMAFIRAHQRK